MAVWRTCAKRGELSRFLAAQAIPARARRRQTRHDAPADARGTRRIGAPAEFFSSFTASAGRLTCTQRTRRRRSGPQRAGFSGTIQACSTPSSRSRHSAPSASLQKSQECGCKVRHTQLCLNLCVRSYAAARSGAPGGGGGAAPGGAGAHPVTPAIHSPRFSPRAGGFAGRPGCCFWCAAAANPWFTHLALAGIQPAPAASLQDRAAAADPQPAPAQEQCTFERAYADFVELGARLDRLNADTPKAARDARIYAETLLSMAGATT